MSERQPGWYWVKNGEQWECLHYSGCFWDGHHGDHDLQEIGPRVPTPDEPWQTVPVEATDAMDEAGIDAGSSNWAHRDGIRIGDAWQAMLAAAPKPGGEP